MSIQNRGLSMKNIGINFFNKNNIVIFIKIFISLTLLLYLFNKIDFSLIYSLNQSILIFVVMSVLLTIGSLFIMTVRWNVLLNTIYHVKPNLIILYRLYFIGTYFNIFLPGSIGGDSMRIHLSNLKYGLGLARAGIIVFAERIIGLISIIVILCIGSILSSDLHEFINLNIWGIVILFSCIILAIVISKQYLSKKIYLSYNKLFFIFLLTLIANFTDIIMLYFYCHYFNTPITLFTIMIIIPIVNISAILPISLGGLGVREGTMAVLFSLIGAEPSVAVIISLLIYLSKVIVGLIGGFIYIKSSMVEHSLPLS